jgi:hypothetical protein
MKTTLEAERDAYKTQLETLTNTYNGVESKLKGFEGIDVEALKGEIQTLNKQILEDKATFDAERANDRRMTATREFIAGKKFKMPELAEYYTNKVNEALVKQEYEGLNREDILNKFIKDEKGNTRTDLFNIESPNNATIGDGTIPPAGDAPPEVDPFKAIVNKYVNMKKQQS